MRISNSANQEAWLFTLAEEKLSTFANRVDQELPDYSVLARSIHQEQSFSTSQNNDNTHSSPTNEPKATSRGLIDGLSLSEPVSSSESDSSPILTSFESFGGFRNKLIETFAGL